MRKLLDKEKVLFDYTFFFNLQTFAYDHCFWSMDPSNEKFASKLLYSK